MRVKLLISYDGTNYSGWQVQPNALSVQEKIEDALFSVTGEKIKVIGSGRTDKGVHADGQVAHFEIEKENIPAEKFYRALNVYLPEDIKVLSSEKVDEKFNARRSAKSKTYSYYTYFSKVEKPLKERYYFRLDNKPDIEKMKKVASLMVGEHDFKCMCASGSGAKTTVRTVYEINIKENGEDIIFSFTGNGFLYNMVRIMVGILLDIGLNRFTEKDVEEMFITGKRKFSIKTLPAKALRLIKVEY